MHEFFQVIDGDEQEDADDPLAYPRNDAQTHNAEQALPPSVHATEVSFEGSSTHELTKSNNNRWDHIEDIDSVSNHIKKLIDNDFSVLLSCLRVSPRQRPLLYCTSALFCSFPICPSRNAFDFFAAMCRL
jgi:hypothetical protein